MSFTPKELIGRLAGTGQGLPEPARYVVAYSGGLDSTVLLHALVRAVGSFASPPPVLAVHVDHQMHPDSAAWAAHCERFAASLGVRYECRRAQVALDAGEGPEAAARTARYVILEHMLETGDWLLSAHHENDQAETLLLNLMRGSGLAGLAGIGPSRPLGRGWLLRPLLGIPRAELERYADAEALAWVEDPSNAESRYDRNFVRHEILPLLQTRWPAAAGSLRRSAELAAEAAALLAELAEVDLAAAGEPAKLDLGILRALPGPRQRNLLRHAIRRLGLPLPPATRLNQVIEELAAAREDAQPLVAWPGAEVRRYRDHAYLLPAQVSPGAPDGELLEPGRAPLSLGVGRGSLALEPAGGPGIRPSVVESGLRIAWREGGERLRPKGHAQTHSLKKLLQDAGIVPWQRARIPLLYSEERLVAVGDLWIASEFVSEEGYRVRWLERPALF
ncbi:MAG: tRNA lysidine(34) synthetase TilS [Gammaproteobacteria bacterium]|nr:tRNA lysidine(34) synthetase TilS [Gammaproteobacteria bacterium]MDH4252930.1 tRNA lysidine(34) synthetase TilS [Gammaproteobacteria bacterium]MDH5308384.1 tRNA lysidine(34) synthetase TilS [Gammaproteobacteria bacterium]